MQEFIQSIAPQILDVALRVLGILAVLTVGLKLAKVLSRRFDRGRAGDRMDPTVRRLLANGILWGMRVLVCITVCALLNIPTASVIAVISSAGLALGLALQGGLSNIAGGIMLVLFRPYKLGDVITTESHTGTVLDISLFYTTLRTADNNHVILPNGVLTGATIVNSSREETRRVSLSFSVAYRTDLSLARKVLLATAAANGSVLEDPAPSVIVSACGDSSVELSLRAWVKSEEYWAVSAALREEVKGALERFGIEIPYQQLDVHIREK